MRTDYLGMKCILKSNMLFSLIFAMIHCHLFFLPLQKPWFLAAKPTDHQKRWAHPTSTANRTMWSMASNESAAERRVAASISDLVSLSWGWWGDWWGWWRSSSKKKKQKRDDESWVSAVSFVVSCFLRKKIYPTVLAEPLTSFLEVSEQSCNTLARCKHRLLDEESPL